MNTEELKSVNLPFVVNPSFYDAVKRAYLKDISIIKSEKVKLSLNDLKDVPVYGNRELYQWMLANVDRLYNINGLFPKCSYDRFCVMFFIEYHKSSRSFVVRFNENSTFLLDKYPVLCDMWWHTYVEKTNTGYPYMGSSIILKGFQIDFLNALLEYTDWIPVLLEDKRERKIVDPCYFDQGVLKGESTLGINILESDDANIKDWLGNNPGFVINQDKFYFVVSNDWFPVIMKDTKRNIEILSDL